MDHGSCFTPIHGTIETLIDLVSVDGDYLIVMTGRREGCRRFVEEKLNEFGVPFDQLVMGVAPGVRWVVNDAKPYAPTIATARAINLDRNAGLTHAYFE